MRSIIATSFHWRVAAVPKLGIAIRKCGANSPDAQKPQKPRLAAPVSMTKTDAVTKPCEMNLGQDLLFPVSSIAQRGYRTSHTSLRGRSLYKSASSSTPSRSGSSVGAQNRPRRQKPHRSATQNAVVVPGLAPRRLVFRRNTHKIIWLRNLGGYWSLTQYSPSRALEADDSRALFNGCRPCWSALIIDGLR
jgi:hypothetical protein